MPRFPTVDEVVETHHDQIARHGGSAGVRDAGLLDPALRAAASSFGGQFLCPDLFEMASAYLFHLVKNHPSIDGNKRVGTAAALVFLLLNGVRIREDEPALSDLVLAVASGQADRGDVVECLRDHVGP